MNKELMSYIPDHIGKFFQDHENYDILLVQIFYGIGVIINCLAISGTLGLPLFLLIIPLYLTI